MHQPLFKGLLGPQVETEEVDPHTVQGGLLKSEAALVDGAAQTRVEQFAAGRVCGRTALGRLGVAATTPILRGEDRAPIWPNGFIGSISHTDTWCAAAVARTDDVRSLGIDLESSTPLKETLLKRVCTPKERAWLRTLPAPGVTGKILFSAKEAVYKCQYPLSKQFLGFHAVEIELGDESFEAVFRQEAGWFKPGDVISGRYLVEEGLVAAACELAR
ncbi:MAG: 4'-phosphopantetheinyl transferase superfamily protein [Deltaproteobacteria bacterium]|nr:4'-phosphopantetheinyl transferase superfamily protein [Deltaproteobacteria bacterium]NND29696.1 4'-phosphopantetheinyl transferase superfamily protein [Myxococcales bacterium]MBT8466049.1 4'-phosphopantetheinyl transferase superfamily protein [Deltaproteobacteria bacterium]MBT8483631.1 4'-phosphopantetheinyl transferase superfamily protein [Deltaproteobacteria bacterium]NNK09308.1 4'-phosphopantetheinyl transferase superfamily protein [Myxococcales bacterium]